MQKLAEEIHKPARRNFPRRRVDIIHFGIGDTWQMDLADMQKFAKENKGYKYFLVIIDIFTKFVWTVPIKDKSSKVVTSAIANIIEKKSPYGPPKNIHSDEGKEFINSDAKSLYKKYNINFYHTFSTLKASIAERVIRTLKEKLYKQFTAQNNHEWLDLLSRITRQYNNSVHRTIGRKPSSIKTKKDEQDLIIYLLNKISNTTVPPPKFKIGDSVRISKYKSLFEKGYTANWTTEVFEILKVYPGTIPTYELVDQSGEIISGRFYGEELQKTNYPDLYAVEKVISENKKTGLALVKFIGIRRPQEILIKALPNKYK